MEETMHEVDFKSYYEEISSARPPHLDHATFSGPVIIKESPGRGRGLFTTRDVKVGELLLCEKAFAHCYAAPQHESPEGSSKTSVLINTHTNRITLGTQSDLLTDIVQKLYKNPSLLPKFNELYHGSYKPVDISVCDGEPIIDA
jgi:hypothetical protein